MIDYEFHEFMIERRYMEAVKMTDEGQDEEFDAEFDEEFNEEFDWRNEPACWTPD